MELISVLMTVFNGERWLKESIPSILNQTHKEIQFIIIDDGSTDNSAEIISSFKDSRIEFHTKEHSGISASFNYGLKFISSQFIAKIGADDISCYKRLEIQYKYLIENPDIGIVGTNFILFNPEKKRKIKVKNPEDDIAIKYELPHRSCIADPTVMIRRELFNLTNGYDEKRTSAEDWDFYLKLIDKTKFHNIQKYLVKIREHSSNISRSLIAFKESEEVMLNYFKKVTDNSDDKQKIAKANFDAGYYYYYTGEKLKSESYLAKAVQLNPSEIRYKRYYYMIKYFYPLISFSRKTGLYKLLNIFRAVDRNNIFFRNKY